MNVESKPNRSFSGALEPIPAASASSLNATSHYSVQVVTKEKDLENLEQDWDRLSETAKEPNAFMTFDWFRAWNQRLTQDDARGRRRTNVLVLKKGGAVAAILPLIYREASGFGCIVRKLEFVGGQGDYNDLTLGDKSAGLIETIVDFFAQTQDQWDLIDLIDLRETGNSITVIEEAVSRAGLACRIVPGERRCPYLAIDAPSAQIISRLSQSRRRTLRNQQHRLDRMRAEDLRVRIIANPHEEPALLERLIAVEAQKRVNGKLTAPFLGRYQEVFQSLFDNLGPRGWIYVALMEFGDRLLAWQLGFRCGKRLWDYLTAYDHAYSHLSPGTMLVPALIDYGFAQGYTEYDFLRDEEPYKMRWANECHQTFRLAVWKKSWTSRARAFVYLDLKAAVYRLRVKGKSPSRSVDN